MNVLKVLTFFAILGSAVSIGTPSALHAQEREGIRVVVDNHSFWDMHVYVVQSGMRRSLGMTTGLSRRSFELPRTIANSDRDIQIFADPVGSRSAFLSQIFYLNPGDQLNITLENYMGLSTATVSERESKDESDSPGGESGPTSREAVNATG